MTNPAIHTDEQPYRMSHMHHPRVDGGGAGRWMFGVTFERHGQTIFKTTIEQNGTYREALQKAKAWAKQRSMYGSGGNSAVNATWITITVLP